MTLFVKNNSGQMKMLPKLRIQLQAEETQAKDSPDDSGDADNDQEEVVEKADETRMEETLPVEGQDHHKDEDEHNFDDIELPQVDYSGYSKHELVETMVLLIENRPPAEIRDDIDRLKILFYKKLKLESEERKDKFLRRRWQN